MRKERNDQITFENTINIHLRILGHKPIGKVLLTNKNKRDGEIDFAYSLKEDDYHIQVTYELHDGNYDSEVNNLLKFNDNSKKILIYRLDETKRWIGNNEYVDCESYLLS